MKKLIIILFSAFFCLQFSQAADSKDMAESGDKDLIAIKKQSLQLNREEMARKSTSELLEDCLNYPYIIDVLFYDDIQKGFDALVAEFNGFKELLSRQDAVDCLYAKMENFPEDFSKIEDADSISRGVFSFKSIILEMLVSNCPVPKADTKQFNRLEQCIDTCIALKVAHTDIFGTMSVKSTQYIKEKLGGGMNPKSTNYTSVTIHTPKGSIVPDTYLVTGDDDTLTPSELTALANILYTQYDGAELISGPTNRYNCHAYAWHIVEGGNPVWLGRYYLDSENIYWTDGSYIEVPEALATKVSYHEYANHSAVRINSSWYQSKWGSSALVKHHPNACPYDTSMPKKYYKQKSYILGPKNIYNSATFSLSNCINGTNVHWSLSGYNLNFLTLEVDSTNTTVCHLTIINAENFPGASLTLTADIMYGSTVVESISTSISVVGIYGDTVPCGYEVYYVNPRPDNTTVEWSVNGSNFVSSTDPIPTNFQSIQPDSYVLANTEHRLIYGTLTATIKSGGNVVATVERIVDTSGGLSGTWYQQPTATDTVNATPKAFGHHTLFEIVPNRRVYLMSDQFNGAEITYQSNNFLINGKIKNDSVISFIPNLPVFINNGSVTINGTYPNSCRRFRFSFFTSDDPVVMDSMNPLQVNTSGSTFEFSIRDDGMEQKETADDLKWDLAIQDNVGNKIYSSSYSEGKKYVNTSGWKNGIYIATAQFGDKKYSIKFSISR